MVFAVNVLSAPTASGPESRIKNQECRDRRWRTAVPLLLVWVGQRAATDTHQHPVAGAKTAVRTQPRLEHLTAVELEREQLVEPEECARADGRGRAFVMLRGGSRREAEHLGAQHHIHRTVERAVQRDL